MIYILKIFFNRSEWKVLFLIIEQDIDIYRIYIDESLMQFLATSTSNFSQTFKGLLTWQ